MTTQFQKQIDERGLANGGREGRGIMPPTPTSISAPKMVQHFQFQKSEICFLWMFRNYRDQKFHDFYHVCYNFWKIYGGFSNYVR